MPTLGAPSLVGCQTWKQRAESSQGIKREAGQRGTGRGQSGRCSAHAPSEGPREGRAGGVETGLPHEPSCAQVMGDGAQQRGS